MSQRIVAELRLRAMHRGIFLVLALTAALPFAAAGSAEAKPAQTVDFDNTQVNKQLVTYEG